MAIKTFTDLTTLPASDINTYLANSGLVYVSAGNFANVGTVDVTGISSTYDFYRLTFTALRTTIGNTAINAQYMNGGTLRNTAYFAASFFTSYLGSSGVLTTTNNGTAFLFSHADSGAYNVCTWDIRGFNNGNGNMTGQYWDTGAARLVQTGGFRNSTETNDRIRLTALSGSITGSWRLYGYREP